MRRQKHIKSTDEVPSKSYTRSLLHRQHSLHIIAMACQQDQIGIYLVGYEADDIGAYGLPTSREVLSFFFYNHNTLKQTIRASARCAVRKCMEIWEQFGIPVANETNCIVKLEALFKEWKSLKESHDYDTESQLIREFMFEDKLRHVFNVTERNALDCITNIARVDNGSSKMKKKKQLYPTIDDRIMRIKKPICKKPKVCGVRRVIKL